MKSIFEGSDFYKKCECIGNDIFAFETYTRTGIMYLTSTQGHRYLVIKYRAMIDENMYVFSYNGRKCTLHYLPLRSYDGTYNGHAGAQCNLAVLMGSHDSLYKRMVF